MAKSNDWMQALTNPMGHVVKKYVFDILQERYGKHEDVLERISRSLVTRNDMENFGRLVAEIYEAGFFKAVNENKEAWEKLGYKPVIKKSAPSPDSQPTIFSQKNQE